MQVPQMSVILPNKNIKEKGICLKYNAHCYKLYKQRDIFSVIFKKVLLFLCVSVFLSCVCVQIKIYFSKVFHVFILPLPPFRVQPMVLCHDRSHFTQKLTEFPVGGEEPDLNPGQWYRSQMRYYSAPSHIYIYTYKFLYSKDLVG